MILRPYQRKLESQCDADIIDDEISAEAMLEIKQEWEMFMAAIRKISRRRACALILYYGLGCDKEERTFAQVGREMRITGGRASQLVALAIKDIRRILGIKNDTEKVIEKIPICLRCKGLKVVRVWNSEFYEWVTEWCDWCNGTGFDDGKPRRHVSPLCKQVFYEEGRPMVELSS